MLKRTYPTEVTVRQPPHKDLGLPHASAGVTAAGPVSLERLSDPCQFLLAPRSLPTRPPSATAATPCARATATCGASQRYLPWGEIGEGWNNTLPTEYTYTGQREASATGGLRLLDYGARSYWPFAGRFIAPDTIVPQPGDPQSLNRYAYVRNNALRYTDPTGMYEQPQIEDYLRNKYHDNWESYLRAWQSDKVFWGMLLAAQDNYVLWAPSTSMGPGVFGSANPGEGSFTFSGQNELYEYQGYGPYALGTSPGALLAGFTNTADHVSHPIALNDAGATHSWEQPLYDYSEKDGPIPTTYRRVTQYTYTGKMIDLSSGSGLPWLITSGAGTLAASVSELAGIAICPECFAAIGLVAAVGFMNTSYQKHYALSTDYINQQTYLHAPGHGPILYPGVPGEFRR